MFFAVVKQRNILEITLSTVASISFVVIVTFAVIIRRLYMKNMSYREIEQGEFSTKLDPISFITYVEHSDCINQTVKTLCWCLNMVLLAICVVNVCIDFE
jgi:hypothetical protein